MTRVRNATNRPLVRFKTGRITGVRYMITRAGFIRGAGIVEHVSAVFDPKGDDSGTHGEMGSVLTFTPRAYPEDGLDVVCVGKAPGEPMPLADSEIGRAFRLTGVDDAGSGRVWGILDEWDTVYEIREKETPCQS